VRKLGISEQRRRSLGNLVDHAKSISEFLSDSVDAFKNVGFVAAIGEAAPWLEAFGEALAPVKFIITLLDKLTEVTDPEKLAYLSRYSQVA
jgi:hypothetical protein